MAYIERPIVPLVYPEITGGINQYSNVLLIDSSVENFQIFVDSVNNSTFPIVYSTTSSKTELLSLLQQYFTKIDRIGIVFSSSLGNIKTFLNNSPFFGDTEIEPYSENLRFIIDIINDFQVKNIDYLACNTLNYSNWKNYYELLTRTTGVIVGASDNKTGNIKYGGDWILESTSQNIEYIYFTQSIEYYAYVLDNVTPWITGTTGWPWYLYVYGNYMYVSCNTGAIQRIDMTAQTPTLSTYISGISVPSGIVIDSTYIHVGLYSNNQVRRYNVSDLTFSTVVSSGLNAPSALIINGNYLYVANSGSNNIIKYDMTNSYSAVTFVSSGLSSPYGLAISGNYMYAGGYGNNTIQQINLSTGAVSNYVTTVVSSPVGLYVYGNNLYVANAGGSITQISLTTGTPVLFSSFTGKTMEGIFSYGSNLYVSSVATNEIYQLALPALPVLCFKEGTLIFTDKGYTPIQFLKPGNRVKTLLHGFVPIHVIGKRTLIHNANTERIKDQLYKCSRSKYPEVFEPLVITGCHSILVDEYENEEQKANTILINGNTYITDDKYRLPACADLRATVYETPGTYTIYHFALDNDDYYMNYGIYANGLLVETSSKRYMKELSNMELIW